MCATKNLFAFLISFLAVSINSPAQNLRPDAIQQLAAIRGLVRRLLPTQAGSFLFEQMTASSGRDVFELRSNKGKILIRGNNANSMAVGLNYYLKYYCLTTVSWYKDEGLYMPAILPAVPQPIKREARCPNRFFLNYCTFGYTMPWWRWADWQWFIDWMALNGVNVPLSITGEEAVWYKVWKKLGFTDIQIRSYFAGPAYLPWNRMAEVDHWEGPLPKSWMDNQLELQKKIVRRERELGMRPVLPAFAGHVPEMLRKKYPYAKITSLGNWAGFDSVYQAYFLDPFDPLFKVIQKSFLSEQTRLFGTSHIYGADPFNEVKPPSWEPGYLADVSGQMYHSMSQVDTLAQWLQMGWIFYHQRKDWTNERIEAFLRAVPRNKMILLDYFCDNTEVWKITDRFYGTPYIWSYLGNFGGNTFLKGDIGETEDKINHVLTEGGNNLWGLGVTLEGFGVNPFIDEYVLEKAWSEGPVDLDLLAESLADRRLGKADKNAVDAWKLLFKKIYIKGGTEQQATLTCASPCLTGHGSWTTDNNIPYSNKDLLKVWALLIRAAVPAAPAAYRFDVVNIGRQVMGNYFTVVRDSFTAAYYRHDIKGLVANGKEMSQIIDDMDELLSTNANFLLGRWLQAAEAFGKDRPEKRYYNEDARRLLTTWGARDNGRLTDYASRDWAGLMKTYYGKRWKLFITYITDAVKKGKPFDEGSFAVEIKNFQWNWTKGTEKYNDVPTGDYLKISALLYAKYAPEIGSRK